MVPTMHVLVLIACSLQIIKRVKSSSNDLPIYYDTLSKPFQDWSRGDHTLSETQIVHNGSSSIMMDPSNRSGLKFHAPYIVDISMYSGIEFWINGGSSGGQDISLLLNLQDNSSSKALKVQNYAPNAVLPKSQWVLIRMPFADLSPPNLLLSEIIIQSDNGGLQTPIYIDDITLLSNRAPGWLYTAGNHIKTVSGNTWVGRGVNIQDIHSCGACGPSIPVDASTKEVKRRIDVAVDQWNSNFIRLTLESTSAPSSIQDSTYLAAIKDIVDHISTKSGVYVEVSLWLDPTFDSEGNPTPDTNKLWQILAKKFANNSRVLFGIVNEPMKNSDGANDTRVWETMNSAVAAIRSQEAVTTNQQHIILVQGTGDYARRLDYYTTHPITAAGGVNIAYEVHVYNPASQFDHLFEQPSTKIPVVIGEFGPREGMSYGDCQQLMQTASNLGIPHLAWTFHERCEPNLLENTSNGGCGLGIRLVPSAWGALVKERLT
jgi:hypothetical protein